MKKTIKLLAATAGASALVALGFLGGGTALAGSGHGWPVNPQPSITSAHMTLGSTLTPTSAATAVATSVASPTYKAVHPSTVAPGGGDWICFNTVPQPSC